MFKLSKIVVDLRFSSTWRINTFVWLFFNYFHERISTSVQLDYNGNYSLENVFAWRIYTSVGVFFNFSLKNIYLSVSWQTWCFLHLKMLSTWRIYTSVWVFINFFCWIPLCELTIMVFPSLEYVFYLKNIHLCTS